MVSVLSSALAHTILYSPWVIYFLCIALDKSFEELFYFWEAAMDNVLLLILGIFLSVLGILNIKGNISTIHSYNRRKVKEEDIPKYGKAVGTGTVIMGASLILAYFATFWNEAAIDYWPGLYPIWADQIQSRYFLTRKKRTIVRLILMRYRKGANKVSTIAIKEQQKLYQNVYQNDAECQ